MAPTLELPPCRGIFAVDTVKFTRNPSAHQPELSAALPRLLGRAFTNCGLTEIWEARRFPRGTGDGYFFGVPHERTPFLLDPLLNQLQAVLEDHDRELRSEDRERRLRLRVAVHLGSVLDAGDDLDRVGTPINDTFRLLDSDAIRHVLDTSSPDITMLAAIVSQRVFEEIVREGYTPGLSRDRLDPVIAEVADKEFAQPAWIYVPKPSRTSGAAPPTARAESVHPETAPAGTTIHGNVGNSVSGGTFSGDVRQTRDWTS